MVVGADGVTTVVVDGTVTVGAACSGPVTLGTVIFAVLSRELGKT